MFRNKNILSEAELSSFCHQINMIIKAGLPIYYGLSILHDDTEDAASKELYGQIYTQMELGTTLFDALAETEAFPDYMLHMVHVGEETGRLEEVFDSLTVYYEREAEIRDGIKQAVAYPLVMSLMMLAVIIVIITNVVPIFADVYAQLGSDLTGTARLLMNISTFLNKYLLTFVGILGVVAVIALLFFQTPWGKRLLNRTSFARSLAASRFANCMYLALASGLDTDQGLGLAESLVGNYYAAKQIRQCRELIRSGESFATALLSSSLFSKMYSSIISIGYKTSAMDDVMLRISKAYENETDDHMRRFISVLEPTLIIILSFFIGLILISFLLPLLGIMSSIG